MGPFSESLILILAASFQYDLCPANDLATSLPFLSSAEITLLCPRPYVWDRCPAETSILLATLGHLQTARVLRIPRYIALFILPSIILSLPVPAEEKQPHAIMLPPPNFTVVMTFLGSYAEPILLQT